MAAEERATVAAAVAAVVATVVEKERVEGLERVELRGVANWVVATVEGCQWSL